MRRLVCALVLAACGNSSSAPDAENPDDTIRDGFGTCPCTYGTPQPVGTVGAPAAIEISGLATSRMLPATLWAHNDRGDTARLFALSETGAEQGQLSLPTATATDWEDLAIAPCGAAWCLYVGDIGDNDVNRPSVQIYEVDEPAAISGTLNATFRAFDIAYPDGAHNAEALFVDPRDGASYVITKQAANPSRVFHMPRTAGNLVTAADIGTFTAPLGSALVTGADLFVDTCNLRLLVRTYTNVFELRADANATIAQLLAATPVMVPVATETQGEAVAYDGTGGSYVTVSEGSAQTLSRAHCLL